MTDREKSLRTVGRPGKLNSERTEAIATALRLGLHREQAATLSGISRATYHNWYNAGEQLRKKTDENPDTYDNLTERELLELEFFDTVELALTEVEARYLGMIHKSALAGNTTDARWFLERAFPHRWGRMERTEISGDPDRPIVIDLTWPEQAKP